MVESKYLSFSGEPDEAKVSRPVRREGRAARPFPTPAAERAAFGSFE